MIACVATSRSDNLIHRHLQCIIPRDFIVQYITLLLGNALANYTLILHAC